jgi:hypothetical protein
LGKKSFPDAIPGRELGSWLGGGLEERTKLKRVTILHLIVTLADVLANRETRKEYCFTF